MDTITQSFLTEFVESKNYSHYKPSDQFEYFTNFCILNKEYDSICFDEKLASTGLGTQGIDGIGIIVNNKLCHSVSEIQNLIDLNRILTVTFVFIQTKTSSSFDGNLIENLLTWTKVFFSENENLFQTEEMKNFLEMKNFIFLNSKFMKDRNPILNLYFCSTGNWNNDPNHIQIINSNQNELGDLNLFEKVNFFPIDAKSIQKLYRKTKEPVEANIKFERKVTIPTIPQIKVAYFGMLPFSEFKKIIVDDSDNIKSVFEDNIRDYLEQENNPVNTDISNTLKNNELDSFCILNNGVTIVAEEISGAGDNITLTNYQIVNGCQTSNVLFENRNVANIDNMHIPVKIIVTENNEIKSNITRATNNQTAVNAVELEALSEFQKNLELYFKALPNNELKLHFERRTNQYKGLDNISLNKIITRESIIKSLASMFLDKPHLVTGYYGKLVLDMGDDIFNKNHDQMPYYISALSYFKLEELLNTSDFDRVSKRFRYQLLMIFRFMITNKVSPNLLDKGQTNRQCNQLLEVLKNKELTLKYFIDSDVFLKSEYLSLDFNDRKTVERKNTTDLILEKLKEKLLHQKLI